MCYVNGCLKLGIVFDVKSGEGGGVLKTFSYSDTHRFNHIIHILVKIILIMVYVSFMFGSNSFVRYCSIHGNLSSDKDNYTFLNKDI